MLCVRLSTDQKKVLKKEHAREHTHRLPRAYRHPRALCARARALCARGAEVAHPPPTTTKRKHQNKRPETAHQPAYVIDTGKSVITVTGGTVYNRDNNVEIQENTHRSLQITQGLPSLVCS